MNVKLIQGTNPIEAARSWAKNAVAIDTETTGLTWTDKITMISMAWRGGEGEVRSAVLVPETWPTDYDASDGEVISNFEEILQAIIDTKVVMHNLPFDFRMLYHLFGVKPSENMHDTMHLAKQVAWFDSLSLAELYRTLVQPPPDWVEAVKEHRKTFMKIPLNVRADYSAWDALATLAVYERLREMAVGVIPANLYRRDLRFSKLVMDMIIRGVAVDADYCRSQIDTFQTRMASLTYKYVDTMPNINSDDQVRNYLFGMTGLNADHLPRTATGKISVAAEVLDTMAETMPDVEALSDIVEYRQLLKCSGSWLTDFLALSQEDGKAHAELHPFGTRSFRMTSKEPNMLALPMEDRGRAFGSLQGMFKSDQPGMQYWGMDAKQAEVRLGAMLAQEDRLADVFQTGDDPYVGMAFSIWGHSDKELRRRAKAAMLAGLYEIGPRTFSLKHKISQAEAKSILDDFRSRFPNIRAASRFYADWAQNHGYVVLHDGRRRYFAQDDAFYKAFNQRVQGGVAEIMQGMMLDIETAAPGQLVLQIHDAVILNAPENEEERNSLFNTIQEIATDNVPTEVRAMTTPTIPFIMEGKLWQ